MEGFVYCTNLPARLLEPTTRHSEPIVWRPLAALLPSPHAKVCGGFSWTPPLLFDKPTASSSTPHGPGGPQSGPAPLSSVGAMFLSEGQFLEFYEFRFSC